MFLLITSQCNITLLCRVERHSSSDCSVGMQASNKWTDSRKAVQDEDVWGLHTEDCACRDWFFIYPEGHLGEDYCHYAGDIRLNHEVAHFPFQVEVDRHHHIFTWRINRNELVWLTKSLKLQADRFQLMQLQTDVTFDSIW